MRKMSLEKRATGSGWNSSWGTIYFDLLGRVPTRGVLSTCDLRADFVYHLVLLYRFQTNADPRIRQKSQSLAGRTRPGLIG